MVGFSLAFLLLFLPPSSANPEVFTINARKISCTLCPLALFTGTKGTTAVSIQNSHAMSREGAWWFGVLPTSAKLFATWNNTIHPQ
jgi:hypothetical protein